MSVNKILLALALFLTSTPAWATIYYVRTDGGTSTQCTGTTNVSYASTGGTGTAQACAFSHPAWALGAGNQATNQYTTGKMAAGDTLIISDASSASYMIGYGMPNTTGCTQAASATCMLQNPPSGASVNSPTKIYGSSYNTGCASKPQLWGTEGLNNVIQLYSRSNIEIQCVELTDHSNCGEFFGANPCNRNFNGTSVGSWARSGVRGTFNTNITFKNVDIHGFARQGILMGDMSGITNFDHVNSSGNMYNGWDGDDTQLGGTGSINSGTVNLNYMTVRFNGCMEAYPRTSSYSAADYSNCTDASQSNDGIGSAATSGIWNITNSDISHNSSDGLDLRYCFNCTSVNIDKTTAEGNEGSQIKVTTKNFNLTNSVVIGNCAYFTAAGKAYSIAEPCRAGGVPIYLSPAKGSVFNINNNTVYAATDNDTSAVFEIFDVAGTADGTETYTIKNNNFFAPTSPSGVSWVPFYNGLSGAASTAFVNNMTQNHNLIYNFQNNPAGTGNVFTAPAFVGSINNGAATNVTNVYPSSNAGGGTSATFWNTSKDLNRYSQNASIDKGAIQYGSTAQLQQSGQTCIAATDCSSGNCSSFTCSGGCTANGGACASGGSCCSGTCSASVCAVAPSCGDGTVQTNLGEVCDGSNVNGSNCTLQGHTGGSLACASNCQSFDTSGCTDTTTFPLTPILDSFTRADSTGISNSSWINLVGSFNISSNAAVPVLAAGNNNKYYWGTSTFTADEEVYTTMSNKGSNSDSLYIFVRYNSVTDNGYVLEVLPASSHINLLKLTAGAETQLGATVTQSMSSGDSFGLSVAGSTLTIYYKASGGSWASKGTRTDTTYTAGGNLAIASFSGGGTPDIKFTNFGGGSLNPITCGNGLKEGSEACDGTDLGGQTCLSQGFASGTLTCATNCNSVVTTSCVSASTCGNNIKETGEVCDGTDINSATCSSLGFSTGTVTCASNCLSFITTACAASFNGITAGVILK